MTVRPDVHEAPTEAEAGADRKGLRPGAARRGAPTIRQVAAAAGVSRATASRVISGSPLVSEHARAAVEAAIADLGFTPNPVARNLARGRTGSVAFVVPEPNSRVLTDPFFGDIIIGLSSCLEEVDQQMVLIIARADGRAERTVRYLTSGHVDGAIIASHHRDDQLNQLLVSSNLPCVFIGRPLGVSYSHYVDLDNVLGARIATEHLIATGRRRIGTIAGPPDMTAGIDRLQGWREAMDAAGLPTDAVAHGDFTEGSGAVAMGRLLDEHPDLDGVFAASDLMASGALLRMGVLGVRVPDDVALVGFDDLGFAATTDPPLTTVAQPVAEMAARAGALLQELIAGEEIDPEPVMFPPRLVLRASA